MTPATTIHPPFQSSERAARRVTAHRRPAATSEPEGAAGGPVIVAPAAHQSSSNPESGPRILRRWSVAELIARAAAGAPALS